jgi:hypothetical protein
MPCSKCGGIGHNMRTCKLSDPSSSFIKQKKLKRKNKIKKNYTMTKKTLITKMSKMIGVFPK